MAEIAAHIRLRPIRIGFLVRPTDMSSVREVMRVCASLWGGVYNPIIPVFRVPPRDWRPERFERVRGSAIATGYIRHFEPDLYVETEAGLLEEAGVGALRNTLTLDPEVLSFSEFLTPQDHRDWSEPAIGLNIADVIQHLYETEHRFQPRTSTQSILVTPERDSGLVEAVFGAFPYGEGSAYLIKSYRNVFSPNESDPSPAVWRAAFNRPGSLTPLRLTRHGIDAQRHWHHDLLVFVFDPTRPTDLIDLWNRRLEPHPVLPVPIDWVESLADDLHTILAAEYRPVRGNPHGVMHRAIIEFGRSIKKADAEEITSGLTKGITPAAVVLRQSHTHVWKQYSNYGFDREKPLRVTAEERRVRLLIETGQHTTTRFDVLVPPFSSELSFGRDRWVNVVTLSVYGKHNIATVLPFNTLDRRWPRLILGADRVAIGREGWVFRQKYRDWTETIALLTSEEAIRGSLKVLGIEAQLSEPGHIAKQMLEQLGGLWGVHLVADLETLQLLNRMAGGLRKVNNKSGVTAEESFERRTVAYKVWQDLVNKRKQGNSLPRLSLDDFVDNNLIMLGVETDCPHCLVKNWHSLTDVDYEVQCERCLNIYNFPQAKLRKHNGNWYYRVKGPFSVPDFGRGSYSALLTLRLLDRFHASHNEMTFSTAMNLAFDDSRIEVDFLSWWRIEHIDSHETPVLVVGETKSLGKRDVVDGNDLNRLRMIGRKVPGSILVVAILREEFSGSEKKLLRSFIRWARRPDERGEPTNPVVLLTSRELLFQFIIEEAWKKHGKPYSDFADYRYTRDLYRFAEATQIIYAGMPSYHQE